MRRRSALLLLLLAGNAAGALPTRPQGPLDALTTDEYWTIYNALRDAGHVRATTVFASELLHAPDKAEVLAWKPGMPFARRADVVLFDAGRSYEARIDLRQGKVERFAELAGAQANYTLAEKPEFVSLIAADPRVQEALRKRGITDMNLVSCYSAPAGYLGWPEQVDGARIGWGGCFYIASGQGYGWDTEVPGLFVILDLAAKKVLRVVDHGGPPIPASTSLYDPDGGEPRPGSKPLITLQPEGPSFEVRDGEVRWQDWRFRFRLDPRVGAVLNLVSLEDGGRLRPVLYEASLSEMFVPYMDRDDTWNMRTYLDAGEYFNGENAGFGAGTGLLKPLQPDVDCPPQARYFTGVFPRLGGTPSVRPNLACLFERETGDPVWRHSEDGAHYGRPGRELVLRTVAIIGNYDYLLDWRFEQDGSLKGAVGSTGSLVVKIVEDESANREPSAALAGVDAEGRRIEFGHLVAPRTMSVNHDHFFSFRLDLDVDGPRNSFMVDRLVPYRLPEPSYRKSIWVMQPSMVMSEAGAARDSTAKAPEMWRFTSDARSPLGNETAFELMPGVSAANIIDADDWTARRVGFTAHQLWVTAYDPDERYAAGTYPTGSKGEDGLPAWIARDRSLHDTDLVAWYTIGFHHAPRPEDWPQMPVMWHDFTLRPYGFYTKNPALDLPTRP